MSQFGEGTFKQALLDWIESERQSHGKSAQETIAALAHILAYLAERSD